MIPHIVLLIPRLPDMVQKCFCTPDGAMDPIFLMKYIPSRFVFNLVEIMITKQIPLFFEAPCNRCYDADHEFVVGGGVKSFSPQIQLMLC